MVLTKSEQQLKTLLTVWSILFLASFIWIWIAFFGSSEPGRKVETLIWLTGTLLLVLTLLSAIARTGVRHHLVLLDVLKLTTFVYGVALLIACWTGNPERGLLHFSLMFGITSLIVSVLTTIFHSRALHARFNLRFLSGRQALAFHALAEVTIVGGEYEILSADDLTQRIDAYLSSFASSRKFNLRIALLALEYIPLGFLRPTP